MPFRTDQWHNLYSGGSGGEDLRSGVSNNAGVAVGGADNRPFIYPDRRIRKMDGSFDVLKRGYIRNITTPENKMNLPSTKCQFQFNPQYLTQSINQNTTILNFLQQDPAQYAQPIPGNVSFNFELFFDRSAEMNNFQESDNSIDVNNPWETGSPGQIGVLHDISTLYSVIGVGLSDAMQEYSKTVLERNVNQEISNRLLNAGDDSSYTNETADADYDKATSSTIPTFLKYNVGNTAFLLPLPVRVVFSSLYIVEGLVKDITVTFTKFNAAMVPMQCTVNINFEAKYIGFAKKDTFFTAVLKDYEDADYTSNYIDEIDATPAELDSYYSDIQSDLSKAVLMVSSESTTILPPWETIPGTNGYNSTSYVDKLGPLIANMMSNQDNNNTKLENQKLYLKVGFPGGKNGSKLADLAVSKNISVKVEARADFWRYTDAFKNHHSSLFSAYASALPAALTTGTGYGVLAYSAEGGASTTPAYEQGVRSAQSAIFNALWDWTREAGDEASVKQKYQILGDNDEQVSVVDGVTYYGNPRAFSNVQRLWTAYLDESHVSDFTDDVGAVNACKPTATGAEEIQNMFVYGLYGSKAEIEDPTGGKYYDRSIDMTTGALQSKFQNESNGLQPDKYPELERQGSELGDRSPFYFAIDYSLKVTVSIDGQDLPQQYIRDGYIPLQKGLTDTSPTNPLGRATTIKYIDLPWPYDVQSITSYQAPAGADPAAYDGFLVAPGSP